MNNFNNEKAKEIMTEARSQQSFLVERKKKKESLARARCEKFFERDKEKIFAKIERSIQKGASKGLSYSTTYIKPCWKCFFQYGTYLEVAKEKIDEEFLARGFKVLSRINMLQTDDSAVVYDLEVYILVSV